MSHQRQVRSEVVAVQAYQPTRFDAVTIRLNRITGQGPLRQGSTTKTHEAIRDKATGFPAETVLFQAVDA